MANLESFNSSKAIKGRQKKLAPKVDLTAMVDLMFLLTTFFMLTTTLSELKAADISKPIPADIQEAYPASRTLTVLLAKNNQAVYYMGETEKAILKIENINTIGRIINANKSNIAKVYQSNPAKFMIVIIKPTEGCNYKNLVDLIDELKIANVKSYSIDDENLVIKEADFLEKKGI